MAANSRLTIAVHALAWLALAEQRGHPTLTSEQVAASVNTNAVVLRRCLGDLGRAGLVTARRGRHAGWSLRHRPERITVLDVFDAVESEPLFALHSSEPNLECPVGRGIRPALDQVYRRATDVLRQELSQITIVDVLTDTLAARSA
ncbi:MAG TPA: Rrf2 family transcriptional regulator [Micromonosporaceae bacterium]|jgi:Rrf2 family protein